MSPELPLLVAATEAGLGVSRRGARAASDARVGAARRPLQSHTGAVGICLRHRWSVVVVMLALGIGSVVRNNGSGSGVGLAALCLLAILVTLRMRVVADDAGLKVVNLGWPKRFRWEEISGFGIRSWVAECVQRQPGSPTQGRQESPSLGALDEHQRRLLPLGRREDPRRTAASIGRSERRNDRRGRCPRAGGGTSRRRARRLRSFWISPATIGFPLRRCGAGWTRSRLVADSTATLWSLSLNKKSLAVDEAPLTPRASGARSRARRGRALT